MASFRFVHCADLHIDSPLRGLEADPDAPTQQIRGATRNAFAALVDYAIAQQVAFVAAAGDLYDGEWQDWRTGQFLVSQVARLSRAGIPFIAIRGNHDAESIITRRLTLPEPARLLSATRPETVDLPEFGVRIHGQSFRAREVTDNLAMNYPAAHRGVLNIGLLHTSVDGREGHAHYAPCTVEQLRNHGYDYWALGHVHTREVLCSEPWIVFSGNLQGRHAREHGAKGATLVTVLDGRIAKAEPVVLDTVRWFRIDVDIAAAADEEAALALTRAAVAEALDAAEGRLSAIRIVLSGATHAHAALHRDVGATREKLRAEASAVAGAETIWLESVSIGLTAVKARASAPDTLLAHIETMAAPTLAPAAAEYCNAMQKHAGWLRAALGDDHPLIAARDGNLPAELVERARHLLLAHLAQE
jgi:exonuclease SbcD